MALCEIVAGRLGEVRVGFGGALGLGFRVQGLGVRGFVCGFRGCGV